RRDFIKAIVGSMAVWPLAARAQQPAMPVVGVLNSASADGYASMASAFKEGLKETAIEYRWAGDQYDRLPALAADLLGKRVTAIFANGPSAAIAKAATATIPIIF